MGRKTGKVRVGLSGWSYRDWHGDFYPKGLARKDELAYSAARFPTLEVSRTFYSFATPKMTQERYQAAPSPFKYAVKASRFITHNKKLHDPEEAVANSMASGIFHLSEKLGPILWQLGPRLRFDSARVSHFFSILPKDLDGVAQLVRQSASIGQKVRIDSDHNHRVRHVIEPLHESFFVPEMARLARDHNVAIAFSHSTAWPYTEEVTAGLVYLRLHGPEAVYASAYSDRQLEEWADRIRAWAERDGAGRCQAHYKPRSASAKTTRHLRLLRQPLR